MNLTSPFESQLVQQVSRERLWETNGAIAQWTRLSGSDEEAQAFAYVQAKLEEYGLRTTRYVHPALISYPLEASLMVIDEDGIAVATLSCLGAAYSASVEDLEAEVIDLGFGTEDDYLAQDVHGKIVLINGLATPTTVYAAEQAGAIGQIFINDDHRHYMIVSTIWGTPTPDSSVRIPSTPSVSVTAADGQALRERCAAGPLWVRLTSLVFMDWQETPLLVGELDGQQSDDFVMFSGHLDSWEVGAMDNGSANATMLEVGRLLAMYRDHLYRGLRLIFWSGHSHGRYSGSTWYADNFWEDLYLHCVAHVNVDSTGAGGATYYGNFPAHFELSGLGADVIFQHTGQQAQARPMNRAGDMSFNGIGIPSLFMSLSQVPVTEADTDYVSQATGKLFGGKMPWWWHTSDDTLDKVDLDVLVLDTQIYTSTLWRLCCEPLLPMDFRPVAQEIQTILVAHDEVAGEHLALGVPLERAAQLREMAEVLATRCREAKQGDDIAQIESINAQLKALSRILIPLIYTTAGRFDHDPAWSLPPLPGLAATPKLAQLDGASDEYHFLRTALTRNRNAVNWALREALALLE